jgi:16S rRNA (cytosine1402-N4)-methyltransferase
MDAERPWPPVPDPAPQVHVPVLLAEVVAALAPAPGRRYLDGTCGLGGHSEALLTAGATVLGVDRDAEARARAAARLAPFSDRFSLRAGTFATVAADLILNGETFDGVLVDLGVSSLQLDDHGRGFSIRAEVRADMRMDTADGPDATDLIDGLSETELADVIFRYGEERLSRRIARTLKRERAAGGCTTAAQIADAVRSCVPGHQPRHPALRTFQALRIAVNDELGELERFLAVLPRLLAPQGAAAVISFHSLEDRITKHALRDHVAAGRLASASRRPIEAGEAESAANPRASSAKMRIAHAPALPVPA